MDIGSIQKYIDEGDLDTAVHLCSIIDLDEKYRLMNQIGNKYEKKGEFQTCLNLAKKVIAVTSKSNNDIELLGALINKAIAEIRLFEYDAAERTIELGMRLINEFPKELITKNFSNYKSSLLNVRGLLSRYLGEINEALEYYNESLVIRRENHQLEEIAKSLANISTIYQIKGELGLALEYNLEAIDIFLQCDNDIFISYCLHDIGITYRMKGDLTLAENFLNKALDTRKKLDNKEVYSETIFQLILLYLEMQRDEDANRYFDELSGLRKDTDSKLIYLRLRICKALIIKYSDRFISRSEAQQIFEEIATEKIINHELTTFVLLNLLELLVYEYKFLKNDVILQEIKKISNTLLEIAKTQNSYSLLTEIYILLYQLSLIELDLDRAQMLLSQAEITAKEHNLDKLADFISLELEVFSEKIKRYNILLEGNASFFGSIEEENLLGNIDLMIKRGNIDAEVLLSIDDPVFILLLNNNGLSLYSKSFNEKVVINKNLIGGFLMASDLGLSNAIKDSYGSFESIKYGRYTLIFQKSHDITCCYAFIGPTHHAIHRLTLFLKNISSNNEIWQLFHQKLIRPKFIYKIIEPIVSELFIDN